MNTTAPLNIAIVGAGPGGLAAALALAKSGHEVHIFEKHRTVAPLGAGVLIQPQGLEALQELGVLSSFEAISMPINRLVGVSHRGWPLVDISYSQRCARGVSRANMAEVLREAAGSAGAQFHFGANVEGATPMGGKAVLRIGQTISRHDVVVLADGAASTLRSQVGLAGPTKTYPWGALWGQFIVPEWDAAAQLVQRYRGTREMLGLLPTELTPQGIRLSFFSSMKLATYGQWEQGDLGRWREHVLSLWPQARPVVDQIRHQSDLSLAVYRHSWPRAMAKGPFAVLGDAAHAMSPQLGLGTTLALQDALALERSLSIAGDRPEARLQAYSAARLWPSRGYQSLSRLLTPCFQGAYGGLVRDVAFAGGRRLPGVQWLMQRSLAEPRRQLTYPSVEAL